MKEQLNAFFQAGAELLQEILRPGYLVASTPCEPHKRPFERRFEERPRPTSDLVKWGANAVRCRDRVLILCPDQDRAREWKTSIFRYLREVLHHSTRNANAQVDSITLSLRSEPSGEYDFVIVDLRGCESAAGRWESMRDGHHVARAQADERVYVLRDGESEVQVDASRRRHRRAGAR